ncbi:MAG: dTDP-4-dehydrorhamnose 3,5-epimerase [Candidatus Micrarchaeia archaeon]
MATDTEKNAVEKLPLTGAFLIKPLTYPDDRGAFSVLFTDDVLTQNGAGSCFAMEFLSTSKKGVLRGLHYQTGRSAQAKLVRCIEGEIYDVIVDLRKSSKTYGKWTAVSLSDKNMLCLFVPKGVAHGYLSMTGVSRVLYKVDAPYSPANEAGIRYDDVDLKIDWPVKEVILSKKDGLLSSFKECEKFD